MEESVTNYESNDGSNCKFSLDFPYKTLNERALCSLEVLLYFYIYEHLILADSVFSYFCQITSVLPLILNFSNNHKKKQVKISKQKLYFLKTSNQQELLKIISIELIELYHFHLQVWEWHFLLDTHLSS